MKTALFLFLSLLGFSAAAQECIPDPTKIKTISNGWGVAYGFPCPNGSRFVLTVLHDYRAANANAQISTIVGAVDQVAAARALMAASAKAPAGAYVAPFNDLQSRMVAIMQASASEPPKPPNSPLWKVQQNPASTTTPPSRPMFAASDPSKTVSERATVGSLCDCSTKVAKGTQTLCPLSPFTGPSASLPTSVQIMTGTAARAWMDARPLTSCVPG